MTQTPKKNVIETEPSSHAGDRGPNWIDNQEANHSPFKEKCLRPLPPRSVDFVAAALFAAPSSRPRLFPGTFELDMVLLTCIWYHCSGQLESLKMTSDSEECKVCRWATSRSVLNCHSHLSVLQA
jgi:hypothetical protein